MPLSSAFIQVPPQSTGLKVDTSELTVGSNTVERQNVSIASFQTAGSVADVNAANQLQVTTEGQKATYGAAATAFSAGTGATTDIFTIYGSASKTVKVQKLLISSTTATAASYFDIVVAKRSTAFSGGTAANPTVVPLDSNNAAGTAVVSNFTAAPTAGSNVGSISSVKYFSPLTGTAAPVTSVSFDFGSLGQPVVLRGVAQGLAVTLNGVTPANAQSWDIAVVWTEE